MKTKQLETKTGGWISWLRDEMVETVLIGFRKRNVVSVETDLVNTKPLETKTGDRILLRDEMVETTKTIETIRGIWSLLKQIWDEMVETVLIGETNVASVATDVMKTKPLETKTGGWILLRDEMVETVLIGLGNHKFLIGFVLKEEVKSDLWRSTEMGEKVDMMDEMGGRVMRERNMESVETDMVNTKSLETKTGGWISNYNNMNNDKEADGDDVKEDGERSFKDFYNVNEEDSESNSSSTSSEHGQTNRFDANSETSSEFKSEEYIFQESESGLHRNSSCYYPFKNKEVSTYVSNNNT
ncbi:hypothetical protein PPACK8108_LOCUS10800 [Phakopsora pachyrhizi]|uniref:Uncharacterized protein n=1 Tax=Phakopsora pachyrhizi TaxID=170000 RepID=A0AAV0B2J1_PHAPC|nr:hypothetical protein PPACK8108_LOCUS10800 [Phakopsora pachyrhizi]